jgi:hypothetical protein
MRLGEVRRMLKGGIETEGFVIPGPAQPEPGIHVSNVVLDSGSRCAPRNDKRPRRWGPRAQQFQSDFPNFAASHAATQINRS